MCVNYVFKNSMDLKGEEEYIGGLEEGGKGRGKCFNEIHHDFKWTWVEVEVNGTYQLVL